ncbi:MAG: NAD(P)-dependent oxidoreductase [Lachnospiraceae bacterium]|nr:NAD(P)-dependent oxidoreductase [Lachnospiraceae bacterium]
MEVYAFCRANSSRVHRIPKHPKVHIVFCDLQDLLFVDEKSIPPCEVFYHFGWAATIGDGRNDMSLQLKNVQYTLDAVNLAKRICCDTFVGAGSQAEYGRYEGNLDANVPTFPENGYGIAKLCAGQMSRLECEKLGIKHIWTRILSVYGPYDSDKTMITTCIEKLLRGEKPSLTKGEQMWDYLYSQDAAKAMILMGEKGVSGKVYCLGGGIARPLKEYITILRDSIDANLKLGLGEIPYGPMQVMYLCANIEELTNDTGFVPEVSFKEGIKKTIEWMRTRGRL